MSIGKEEKCLYKKLKKAICAKCKYDIERILCPCKIIMVEEQLYFYLIQELESDNAATVRKNLGTLAQLKAFIVSKTMELNWIWQVINIVTALVALLVALVSYYDTNDLQGISCVGVWSVIFILGAIMLVVADGIYKKCVYGKSQYILSVVESVEAYYLNLLTLDK